MSSTKEEEERKTLHNKKVTMERIAFWAFIFGSIFWSSVLIVFFLIWIYKRYQISKIIINKDFKCPKQTWKNVKNIPEEIEACHCYFTTYLQSLLGCTDTINNITKI